MEIDNLTRQQKTLKTRKRIIGAAFELFMRRDYNLVSTQEIAEKAGVAKGTVFHHFKNKEILAISTLKYIFELEFQKFEELAKLKPDQMIRGMMEDLFAMVDQYPGLQQLCLTVFSDYTHSQKDHQPKDKVVCDEIQELLSFFEDWILQFTEIFKNIGHQFPEATSRIFIALLDGLGFHLFLFPFDPKVKQEIIDELVRLFGTNK